MPARFVLLPLVCLLLWSAPAPLAAAASDDVEAATKAWATAFNSRDTAQVVALYAPDAVFWGTSSATLRDTPALIREYFSTMGNRPQERVEIGDHRVRVYGDVAVVTGSYTFLMASSTGEMTRRPARFSFTFHRVGERWMIVDHHSSASPAPR